MSSLPYPPPLPVATPPTSRAEDDLDMAEDVSSTAASTERTHTHGLATRTEGGGGTTTTTLAPSEAPTVQPSPDTRLEGSHPVLSAIRALPRDHLPRLSMTGAQHPVLDKLAGTHTAVPHLGVNPSLLEHRAALAAPPPLPDHAGWGQAV
ncbi:unnamed protein product [Mycena citricolor]|uniref:Uncharacterized protein n=1 Tax=Mycena citricolor TaxID=2018698 RepID=A0AAD2K3X5_9AGAR|nr:unnamed protein product [Mycena citricolor]